MLDAIVHHGTVSDTIEYFATVTGPEVERKFFFEQIIDDGPKRIRYFGGGSEIEMNPEGVSFKGNGGIFSEYMFGGHFPLRDLLNEEVSNRLVLYGGVYNPETHELTFTSNTAGRESWEHLFFDGNAVSNYFFFIDEHGRRSGVVERQEKTLRAVGKLLKRSPKVGGGNFLALAREMYRLLDEPESTLILIRGIQKHHQAFYDRCIEAYGPSCSLANLTSVAKTAMDGLDPYQRERIQIDVIYHHRQNRALIDEYKRVLALCTSGTIGASERARLQRLRTLALRNDVPLSIFDTLEEIVLQDRGLMATQPGDEPEFIQSTRAILESFLLGGEIAKRLSSADQIQLLQNKQQAVENRDPRFEEVLLETGRQIDEQMRDAEDFEKLESFTEMATLFDRFDHTSGLVSRLAFMDDVEITEEQVRSVLGNMKTFENLEGGLFRKLFIDPVASNRYALSFGRRKLYALIIGLTAVEQNQATLANVTEDIRTINHRERAYYQLYALARKRMSTFYLELNTHEGRETFRREIVAEFDVTVDLADVIEYVDEKLIDEVITKIRLEAFYINHLLPKIIHEQSAGLREDFLQNSGLDLFQVEELEAEYFEMRSLPPQLLLSIRDEGRDQVGQATRLVAS